MRRSADIHDRKGTFGTVGPQSANERAARFTIARKANGLPASETGATPVKPTGSDPHPARFILNLAFGQTEIVAFYSWGVAPGYVEPLAFGQ